MNDRDCLKIIKQSAHTPQNGIEAVPACGPASDIKFLTCFTFRKSIRKHVEGNIQHEIIK